MAMQVFTAEEPPTTLPRGKSEHDLSSRSVDGENPSRAASMEFLVPSARSRGS